GPQVDRNPQAIRGKRSVVSLERTRCGGERGGDIELTAGVFLREYPTVIRRAGEADRGRRFGDVAGEHLLVAHRARVTEVHVLPQRRARSEERRVGKEGGSLVA